MIQESKDQKYRKNNRLYRAITKKIARLFVYKVFPQHLQEKFMETLTTDELELFKNDIRKEKYKIEKKKG